MKRTRFAAAAAIALVMTATGCTASPADDQDVDTASHCSKATLDWAVSQSAKNATVATADQLADAPEWLPTPACATVSTIYTLWVYPQATRQDFDDMVALVVAQGLEMPDPDVTTERIESIGENAVVSMTSAGIDGAKVQTLVVNVG